MFTNERKYKRGDHTWVSDPCEAESSTGEVSPGKRVGKTKLIKVVF